MEKQIHNVGKNRQNGKLWLFDNEFSVFQGAQYLYTYGNTRKLTKYFWFHERVLRMTCMFKRETIYMIQKLARKASVADFVLTYVRNNEPLFDTLEKQTNMSEFVKNTFYNRFHERFKFVIAWVEYCKQL